MSANRLRRRVEGVQAREVVGDTLVLDLESGQIHQLNETAGFIWRHCEAAPSVEELAQLLVTRFEVGQDRAMTDVTETLGQLRQLNLLVEAPGDRSGLRREPGNGDGECD